MACQVKICGLRDGAALAAALEGGTAFIGFNFYKLSPNYVAPIDAARLAALVPRGIVKTGLFVDAMDEELRAALAEAPLDLIQLHGRETPERVTQIKHLTGLPVMKALRLKTHDDFAAIAGYDAVADRLLFDSRAGLQSGGTLEWARLKELRIRKPWMLAGGLTAGNLVEAVSLSGANTVDVSSGVEDAPGIKSPAKISGFLAAAALL